MKRISGKIGLLSVAVAVVVATTLIAIFAWSYSKMVKTQSDLLDTTLRESFDRSVKWEIETAVSMLDRLSLFAKENWLPEAQTRELARSLLRDMRFGDGGYF